MSDEVQKYSDVELILLIQSRIEEAEERLVHANYFLMELKRRKT